MTLPIVLTLLTIIAMMLIMARIVLKRVLRKVANAEMILSTHIQRNSDVLRKQAAEYSSFFTDPTSVVTRILDKEEHVDKLIAELERVSAENKEDSIQLRTLLDALPSGTPTMSSDIQRMNEKAIISISSKTGNTCQFVATATEDGNQLFAVTLAYEPRGLLRKSRKHLRPFEHLSKLPDSQRSVPLGNWMRSFPTLFPTLVQNVEAMLNSAKPESSTSEDSKEEEKADPSGKLRKV